MILLLDLHSSRLTAAETLCKALFLADRINRARQRTDTDRLQATTASCVQLQCASLSFGGSTTSCLLGDGGQSVKRLGTDATLHFTLQRRSTPSVRPSVYRIVFDFKQY